MGVDGTATDVQSAKDLMASLWKEVQRSEAEF